MWPDPVQCSGPWHNDIAFLLYDFFDWVFSLLHEPVDFLIPESFAAVEIHFVFWMKEKVTFFKLRSEFLNVLEFHWVPFAGVWTVVDIDRTHIDVLLMATGPDAPDLEVKLRERAAWHFLVQIAQQVELLFVSQESPIHSLIDVVEQQAI